MCVNSFHQHCMIIWVYQIIIADLLYKASLHCTEAMPGSGNPQLNRINRIRAVDPHSRQQLLSIFFKVKFSLVTCGFCAPHNRKISPVCCVQFQAFRTHIMFAESPCSVYCLVKVVFHAAFQNIYKLTRILAVDFCPGFNHMQDSMFTWTSRFAPEPLMSECPD